MDPAAVLSADRLFRDLKDVTGERNKHAELRRLTSRIFRILTPGKNAVAFLSHIVQLLPSNDLLTKRFCNLFLNKFLTTVPDLQYLVANTLQKDCVDPNPLIRSLALQTFCCIPTFAQYSEHLISQGLQDSSGNVRRTAGLCCARIANVSQALVYENGHIDDLYTMLRDSDPIVVSNCLNSLEEILQIEGGVVMNKKIAQYLLSSLKNFTDWGLVHVLHYLCKYSVSEDEDVSDILELLEPFYNHPNLSVCIAVMEFLLHVDASSLPSEPFSKLQKNFCSHMTTADSETLFVMLDFVGGLVMKRPDLFASSYGDFFCHHADNLNIKIKKINLLAKLVDDENVLHLLKELQFYASDISADVSANAVETIGMISMNEQYQTFCLDTFFCLLDYQHQPTCCQVLKALKSVSIPDELHDSLYSHLQKCDPSLMNSEGRSAFLWLLGESAHKENNASLLLQTMLFYWEEEHLSLQFKLNFLIAAFKLFLSNPTGHQYLLGQILSLCATDQDLILKDKLMLYYYLLKSDLSLLKIIITLDKL